MVNSRDWDFIYKPLSVEEIKDTLFHMGSLKAPGFNGLHALFFQSQWNVLSGFSCGLVFKIFQFPAKIRAVNQTFISLILKVDHPEVVKHFRPIGLCIVIYKVITKILANTLMRIMLSIIAPTQCGFILGCNSSSNIIWLICFIFWLIVTMLSRTSCVI